MASANGYGLSSFPCLPKLFLLDWIIPDTYLQDLLGSSYFDIFLQILAVMLSYYFTTGCHNCHFKGQTVAASPY